MNLKVTTINRPNYDPSKEKLHCCYKLPVIPTPWLSSTLNTTTFQKSIPDITVQTPFHAKKHTPRIKMHSQRAIVNYENEYWSQPYQTSLEILIRPYCWQSQEISVQNYPLQKHAWTKRVRRCRCRTLKIKSIITVPNTKNMKKQLTLQARY